MPCKLQGSTAFLVFLSLHSKVKKKKKTVSPIVSIILSHAVIDIDTKEFLS